MTGPAPHDHGPDLGHRHHPRHRQSRSRPWAVLVRLGPHSHDPVDKVDRTLEASREGLRALRWSLAGLAVTAVLQAGVFAVTQSVALLSDTLHNVADALTAVPLGIAFMLARRKPNRRYTYGYGRAEDLAGAVIVLVIAASAALAGYESLRRLFDPEEVDHLAAVALAGLVGFAGNEAVAQYRIRVGRRIGSAALVADGVHARTDGFTSLAVVIGAAGMAAGWEAADAVVGLVITVAILVLLLGAARDVLRRLMDGVDPQLISRAQDALTQVPGVEAVGDIRLRWIGHVLRAEATVVVDMSRTVGEGHAIAEGARHALLHEVPRLADAVVHVDPCGHDGTDAHADLQHHAHARPPSD